MQVQNKDTWESFQRQKVLKERKLFWNCLPSFMPAVKWMTTEMPNMTIKKKSSACRWTFSSNTLKWSLPLLFPPLTSWRTPEHPDTQKPSWLLQLLRLQNNPKSSFFHYPASLRVCGLLKCFIWAFCPNVVLGTKTNHHFGLICS